MDVLNPPTIEKASATRTWESMKIAPPMVLLASRMGEERERERSRDGEKGGREWI